MNREIARPEITTPGGASPPYRPLDEPGHDADFAEPLDITALQGILAAELEAQSPKAASSEPHQGEEGEWTSPATPGRASPGPSTTPHHASGTPMASASSPTDQTLHLSGKSYSSGGVPGSPVALGSSAHSPDVVSLLVHDDGTISTTAHQTPASVTSEPHEDPSSVLPADSLEAPSWRLEPEAVHPSIDLKRNFAWNPWCSPPLFPMSPSAQSSKTPSSTEGLRCPRPHPTDVLSLPLTPPPSPPIPSQPPAQDQDVRAPGAGPKDPPPLVLPAAEPELVDSLPLPPR